MMLRLGGLLWLVMGWVGIASGVSGIIGAFELAEEYLGIGNLISTIFVLIWFLGVGVGLWWRLPTEEEAHPA